MKGLSNKEFQNLVSELQTLVGCRFQELGEEKNTFLLNFWRAEHGIRSWILDLDPRNPLFLEIPEVRKARSPIKKSPITLFIKAHIEGRILKSVDWNPHLGRVLNLNFGEKHSLQLRLFTGGANWLVRAEGKSLSLKKPMELKDLDWKFDEGSHRPLTEVYKLYQQSSRGISENQSRNNPENHQKKMEKAIFKLKEDIAKKKAMDWSGLGNWLLQNQSFDVPDQWKPLLDNKLSAMENSQRAFQKAKDLKAKLIRAEKRLMELERELLDGPQEKPTKKLPLNLKSDAKGRTKTLSSGHPIFIGKNAGDNLKILRAASIWDYWLHLKDYPGAHAILRRHRKEKLGPSHFHEAGQLLVLEHLKKKHSELSGESFQVLVAEVRHVRPIKGDKLGRVNYSNEVVLNCKFDS